MTANWTAAPDAHLRVEDIDWGSTECEDMFTSSADDLLVADPRAVRRAETAPMVLTIMGTGGSLCVGGFEEVNPDEEYRYTEEYHQLYYSKNPRDPRMLLPLTRRRHHLVREARAPGALAVPSGERPSVSSTNGAVGDRVGNGDSDCDATAAVPEASETLSSQALVKLYVDTFRPDWDYAQIKAHICTFCRDQDGSRLVQRLLEKPENIVPIFNEVIEAFGELATDVFGNYVLQKMFDVVPKVENDLSALQEIREARLLDRLTEKVRGHLLEYSVQTYGCRVMQKAVENMRAADRDAIIRELDGRVVDFVFDQNANHVVQKVVEVCPAGAQFVVDAFIPSLGELACHAYGCRVLQRTFEKCHDVEGVNIRPLMEAVLSRVNEFTVHQYGNYVVQHAMLNAPEDLRHRFVVQLTPQLYALSCSKFASNVAERIVTTATEEERDAIINELKKPLSDFQGGNYLVNMMQDTYANYVVQRFFEAVSATQRELISELVQPHIGTINQSVYGRHLLRKMVSNNILTNAFLLGQGIDVSGPDYGGNANNNGHRSGGHRGSTNNTDGTDNRHNGGGSTHASRNGNGRGNRAGRSGRGGNSHSNNQHSDGKSNALRGNDGSSPSSMLLLQPHLQLQQPLLSGYMPLPQQYQYGNPYGIPQLQQQQPQVTPQAFVYPTASAAPQLYQPQQAYMPQLTPSDFGAFPGAAAFPTPILQQQPASYALQYGTPMQQLTTMPPQQHPARRGDTQSPQVYVNGGYNGAGQAHQQQSPQNSGFFHSPTPPQPQPVFQGKSDLADATVATRKGGRSGKGNASAVSNNASYTNAVSGDKAGAFLTNNVTSNQQRAGYGNRRTQQQETGY
ncbi:pumilio protein 2, putative [Leishmania panamensis]|uniref:Pumilio protein 2, putative n=1 Tax=Leishmania panamensis TaxID=5679 RepID=A0A088RPZ7_LEIPA|nr:pumilio protein 2, putative [Leishmania panamensis]AIN97319.1 pumilio protein 2, putative [Leishmania panamensis]